MADNKNTLELMLRVVTDYLAIFDKDNLRFGDGLLISIKDYVEVLSKYAKVNEQNYFNDFKLKLRDLKLRVCSNGNIRIYTSGYEMTVTQHINMIKANFPEVFKEDPLNKAQVEVPNILQQKIQDAKAEVEKAMTFATQAIAADNAQEFDKAYNLYRCVLECFDVVIRHEKDPKTKEILTQRVGGYVNRMEQLKKACKEKEKLVSTILQRKIQEAEQRAEDDKKREEYAANVQKFNDNMKKAIENSTWNIQDQCLILRFEVKMEENFVTKERVLEYLEKNPIGKQCVQIDMTYNTQVVEGYNRDYWNIFLYFDD